MKPSISCTNKNCSRYAIAHGPRPWITTHGSFRRACDSRSIRRYRCKSCGVTFSNQTFNPTYQQKKPRLNSLINSLICSKVSLRRVARICAVNRKTVHRKFVFLSQQAHKKHQIRLQNMRGINFIQADEMETFEHTKCKPLSIALAVVPGKRIILGAIASEMPASGHLAKISREKYGPRPDNRKIAFQQLLASIKPSLTEDVWVLTDKKTTYRSWINAVLPTSTHFKVKGKRGAIVGYGEMKKATFDPLFYLNHSAAMARDNLARLLRRSWCTTKLKPYLQRALDLYVNFHNEMMDELDLRITDRESHLATCRLYGSIT